MKSYCIIYLQERKSLLICPLNILKGAFQLKLEQLGGNPTIALAIFNFRVRLGQRCIELHCGTLGVSTTSFIDDYQAARETGAAFVPKTIPWCNMTQHCPSPERKFQLVNKPGTDSPPIKYGSST